MHHASECEHMNEIQEGRVLIVGDGDLSFSRSFRSVVPPEVAVVGTVIEKEVSLCDRYPTAEENIAILREKSNTYVLFEIDATNLEGSDLNLSTFRHIIFNFPHTGGKTNLRKCKELLKKFLLSAKKVLSPHGFVHVTFAKGQSGISEEAWNNPTSRSSVLPEHKKDSWQAIYVASECGFLLDAVTPFSPSDYPEYQSTGYKNSSRSFHSSEAVTLTFRRSQIVTLTNFRLLQSEETRESLHQFRPYFIHDIAFWTVESSEFPHGLFSSEVSRLSKTLVKQVTQLEQFSYFCSEKQLYSFCFRMIWQSEHKCLNRETARDLQILLRTDLESVFRDVHGLKFVLR